MSRTQPSWQEVARLLANRLQNHAFCEAHPEGQPGEQCPFCEDRAAYRLWQHKAGVRDVPQAGREVNIRELGEASQ